MVGERKPSFPDVVTRYTVPIHPVNAGDAPGLGSGVFLRIADEFFVLTARHVFEPYIHSGAMGIRITGKTHGSVDLMGAVIHVTTGVDDVGIVRVPADAGRQMIDLGYEPATSAVLHDPPPNSPGMFAFCGYPREVVRPLESGAEIRYLLFEGIEPTTPSSAFLDYDERHHASFTWPNDRSLSALDDEGKLRPNVDPTGMSGGGIWWSSLSPGNALMPGVHLVGIENAWDQVDKLRITKIARALQFLFQNVPDLKAVQRIMLPGLPRPRIRPDK
jgi:hypothetical protein